MLFNTFQFFAFFVVVLFVYFALPDRWRNGFVLIASYYFYMCWSVRYMAVIWGITIVDYIVGLQLEKAATQRARKVLLILSILCNFGLLFLFKYYDFFGATMQSAIKVFTPHFDLPLLHLLLPVGISFHTFQAVSYTVEVYRGRAKAEHSLLRYALYVAFFPQMVAGPIERPNQLLPQFRICKSFHPGRVRSGLEWILWGLFKKVVVADLLAGFVTTVYARPRDFSGPMLLVATIFFTFQIYCDFSGYSDMAVGIGRIMGYELTINFRQPYLAQSIGEFWRRWHISLSTWFRDYLYIPLGGNRVDRLRFFLNLMIVFLVSGLWHGANWTFIIWGGVHGLYSVIGNLTADIRGSIKSALGLHRLPGLVSTFQVVFIFCLVTLAWIFFRANNVSDALYVASHLWTRGNFRFVDLFAAGLYRFQFLTAAVFIFAVMATDFAIARRADFVNKVWASSTARWSCYYLVFWSIVFFGVFQRLDFIYFQF